MPTLRTVRWIPFLLSLCLTAGPAEAVVRVRIFSRTGLDKVVIERAGQGPRPVTAASGAIDVPAGPWRLRSGVVDPLDLTCAARIRPDGKHLVVTLEIPDEEYVGAVLSGEAGGIEETEALKALAVTARTYSFRFRGRHQSEGYDFCDTTHCQDFRVRTINSRVGKAVADTQAELLWFQGSPITPFYSKDCGGRSEAAAAVWPEYAAPYLPSRSDPYCTREPWVSRIPARDLARILQAAGFSTPSLIQSISVASRTASGRASRVRAGGIAVSASSLRFAIGRALGWQEVRSDLYDIAMDNGIVEFRGRGSGHGVGLCQAGAVRMARDGHAYREILEQYFPGTAVSVNARGFRWQAAGGERVDVMATDAEAARQLARLADPLAARAEVQLGLHFPKRPQLRLYPSVAAFRNATGEPGSIAASTRGKVIRLQPKGASAGVVRHELLHLLVESHAHPNLPLWFREGVVLYLTSPVAPGSGPLPVPADSSFAVRSRPNLDTLYRVSVQLVARLMAHQPRSQLGQWIRDGLSAEMIQAAAR